jgi:hypothetical protein
MAYTQGRISIHYNVHCNFLYYNITTSGVVNDVCLMQWISLRNLSRGCVSLGSSIYECRGSSKFLSIINTNCIIKENNDKNNAHIYR